MRIIHYYYEWNSTDKFIVCQKFNQYQNYFVNSISALVKLQVKWTNQNPCHKCYVVASYVDSDLTSNIINHCGLYTHRIIGSNADASFFRAFPKFKYGITQIDTSSNSEVTMQAITDHPIYIYSIHNLEDNVYQRDLFGIITTSSLGNALPIVQNSNTILSSQYIFVSAFANLPSTLFNAYHIVGEQAFNQLIQQEGENSFTYELLSDSFVKITSSNYEVTVYISTLNALGYEIDLSVPSGPLVRNVVHTYANMIYKALNQPI